MINFEDFSLAVHSAVLEKNGTEWARISTDLSNDLIDKCEEVEEIMSDFIREVDEEFKERITEEVRLSNIKGSDKK